MTILLATSCGDQILKTINKNIGNSRFDFSSIENKFEYSDQAEFSIDTIQWDKRKDFYTKLDSLEFFQIYQDTAKKEYLGQYSESIDNDFFYSKQKSKRGLWEFTILTQREGEYCDRILYNIYALDGKLISSFRVAGSCGDGGYYETSSGKFLNDSTYELFSEDNYKTEDVEKPNIITYSKTLTIIKPNGTIAQTDMTLKTETK
ncbi:hypothetical protein [Cyclobacterium qasimii]|uniref:hypothetical protein n=1 Tax=Cyclobacterium qasimii TaxID=1350429 RepID=UPI00058E8EF6|nr:hypothetical protein [Cyclobacterium qasimii]